jgi:ribosomal RNA-processing protein 36
MPSVKRRKGKQEGSDDSDASASDAGRDRDRKKSRSHRPEKRSSKHAPTEMTSKRPVSRKREFDTVAKPQVRDPRFDPTINSTPGYDEHRAKKAYAFLDEYRASEMAELRGELKRERDPAERQRIERLLMSMESKKKAEDRKEREHRIIVEHRRAEKELVKQGKQPFYLKKSEQKKRLLTEQFKGMKRKQVDKSIERRRKKVATRERIELEDMQRRT